MTEMTVPEPVRLVVDSARSLLGNSNVRYEKRLGELAGLYRDGRAWQRALAADDGEPVYWVESSSVANDRGALTIGISALKPGRIGDEFAMTRGHIHAHAAAAELYYGLSGVGVMLMETITGESRAIEISPGIAVHVPGHWIHRSVNVGEDIFSTLFCYPTDAGQDYTIIGEAGGMRTLIVADDDGWTQQENPDHLGYRLAGAR